MEGKEVNLGLVIFLIFFVHAKKYIVFLQSYRKDFANLKIKDIDIFLIIK